MASGCGAWHWPATELRERRDWMCSSAVTLALHGGLPAEAVERTEETETRLARLGCSEGRSYHRTCEADQTELEAKSFSPREAQNWAARLPLTIFYLSAVFTAT